MDTRYLSAYVTKLLFFLGFSPRTKGFAYVREMVVISYFNKRVCLNQIYIMIADKTGQPTEAIQTAIRTALKNAQSGSGFKKLEGLMGTNFIQARYLIPPREFLGLIGEYLTYFWDGKSDISPLLFDIA